jgi:hypothetical protein
MRHRSGTRRGGETADTSSGGEEGGLDGESRLADRVVVVVSPGAAGAGEGGPGSGGRGGAPGEGRREPPPHNPQHLVAVVGFLRRFGGGSRLGFARSPHGRKRLEREKEKEERAAEQVLRGGGLLGVGLSSSVGFTGPG